MNEPRATRYQRILRRARSAGVICGLALLTAVVVTPTGRDLATWSQARATSLPSPLSSLAALLLFVAVMVIVWEAVLALIMLGWRDRDRSRRASAGSGGALAGQVMAAAIVLPVAVWCGLTVQAGAWLADTRWWIVTGVLLVATFVVAMHVLPSALAHLAGARPLKRPALIERLGALARRLHVDIQAIEEVPAGAAVTATALVAGAGQSRRVFISSDLLQDWSDEEIAVVVAHELGHHAHHDLWLTLGLDAVLLTGGLRLADIALGRVGQSAGDLAALPLVALITWATFVAATPLRHALSRWQERRADAFALQLTGGAAEFKTALRRLASRHLVEERPSRATRWLYHRHPTVAERLSFADDFEKSSSR
jgi:STE24 endopeptidase